MTFPLPTDWTDSTPASGVHASTHDSIATLLNKFAVGGASGDVLAKQSSADGDVGWSAPASGGGGCRTVKHDVTFSTPLAGEVVTTWAEGELLFSWWMIPDIAFDGTQPCFQVGITGSPGALSSGATFFNPPYGRAPGLFDDEGSNGLNNYAPLNVSAGATDVLVAVGTNNAGGLIAGDATVGHATLVMVFFS